MMAVLTHSHYNKPFGLRPMDPMKDLDRVADLIEKVFADDLDRTGQNALQELRWLSRFKPLLWWMVYVGSEYDDFLSGFVWEEEEQIVGNITVTRASPGSRKWLISNVAVSGGYRRRGVARCLMDASLELAKEYKAEAVSLHVRANNLPARKLYESLHFREITGIAFLRATRVPRVALQPLPAAVRLRPRHFTSQESEQIYHLAIAATPPAVQKEWPLTQSRFHVSHLARSGSFLRCLIGGSPSAYWLAEDGRRVVAALTVVPGGWGQTHDIQLIVHPDWRGDLEKPLLSHALTYLYRWRQRGLAIKHPTDHPQAIKAYTELGIKEEQTLLWMKREF
jgi:ribosomal protein S18 acetylase RimI-like enzyme